MSAISSSSQITILFVNVGRRVELLRNFRSAFDKVGVRGRIITTDLNELNPALYLGDAHYILPRSEDPASDFVEKISLIIQHERVDLVIPLTDLDLEPLARNQFALEQLGVRVLVSRQDSIEICNDKEKSHRFLKSHGWDSPELFSLETAFKKEFPQLVKPRRSSGSANVFRVNNPDELAFFTGYVHDSIIQEFLIGEETTTDVFSDWLGAPHLAVARRRLKVKVGEVSIGRVVRNVALEELCMVIARELGTVGPINIQTITQQDRYFVIDINPRFAGGVPLSIAAGAPFAEWTVRLALGQKIANEAVTLREGLTMMRFDDSLFFNREDLPLC